MSDKKAELHELHVILGTTGLRTGDIHVSPKVLQILFEAVVKANIVASKGKAPVTEVNFTDAAFDARCAKEELKYALEGLAYAIWEEAKQHE